MSKADKESMARISGMEYAVRRIRETSLEEFEKELRWRNRNRIGMTISPQEISEASNAIKAQTYDTIRIMTLMLLLDKFDFTVEQVEAFNDAWNFRVECLTDNYVEWDDYKQALKDEYGIETEIQWNR